MNILSYADINIMDFKEYNICNTYPSIRKVNILSSVYISSEQPDSCLYNSYYFDIGTYNIVINISLLKYDATFYYGTRSVELNEGLNVFNIEIDKNIENIGICIDQCNKIIINEMKITNITNTGDHKICSIYPPINKVDILSSIYISSEKQESCPYNTYYFDIGTYNVQVDIKLLNHNTVFYYGNKYVKLKDGVNNFNIRVDKNIESIGISGDTSNQIILNGMSIVYSSPDIGKCLNDSLNTTNTQNIYMIGGVNGGGSLKFINDFISMFPQTKRIQNKKELYGIEYSINDILFIQHVFQSDMTFDMICELYYKYKYRVIVSIHDWYYLSNNVLEVHNKYLSDNIVINDDVCSLFNIAQFIIHPSQFTYDIYSKYFSNKNFIHIPHIDYQTLDSKLLIPPITNIINIGVMHEYTTCKGIEYLDYLRSFDKYKNYTINFVCVSVNVPIYVENEFFEYCKKYNLHCLMLLNKWGETYCYSLSKFLKSGLPILYNGLGAINERMPDEHRYIKVFYRTVQFDDDDKKYLLNKFNNMMDYVIENAANVKNSEMIGYELSAPPVYRHIFDNTYHDKQIWDKIHTHVKPFCIYFPQFHQIHENDINFYTGMTDMKNLIEYMNDGNRDNLDSPNIELLGLNSLDEYDLSKKSLIDRQIELARNAGIYGFCIYYYWFSINTLTDKNSIMEKCYDNFFINEFDNFKVFFNWANEDWTKNVAFISNDNTRIENKYSFDDINANFENLIKYFVHPNYYKINNSPVFYIHHPWFITDSEMQLIIMTFNYRARQMGFDGMHIVVNSMVTKYSTPTFLFAPNYKDPRYTDNYNNITSIQDPVNTNTIFFSFNNSARMYKPSKPHLVKIQNTTPKNQKSALNVVLNTYITNKRNELQKILLINSWNEWGEDMSVEPGIRNGSFYLDLIRSSLSRFLVI